jgi:hypothetical protein
LDFLCDEAHESFLFSVMEHAAVAQHAGGSEDFFWIEHQDAATAAANWADAAVGGDARFALDQIVALCVRSGADLYAAGDLFDGPDPTPEALADLYAALRPLADAGRAVYYVLGNHDRGRDWLVPFGPRAVRLDGRVVDAPLGAVTGLSYAPPDRFPALAAAVPPVAVGLYHQTWAEFGRAGRAALGALPAHRLAVCGDVHVRVVRKRPPGGPGGGPVVAVSPGPLAPQSVTEFAGAPCAFGATAAGAVVRVPLAGRRFVALAADAPGELDRAVAAVAALAPDPALPEAVAAPFVCVKLGAGAGPHARAALTEAAARVGVVLRTYAPVAAGDRVRTAAPAPAAPLADAIAAAPGVSDAVKDLARAAVESADPGAVFAAHRTSSVAAKGAA